MLKVVLDTNQLISSLLSSQGLQRQLVDAWRQRAFLLLLVPGQIDEVADILNRPRIRKKYHIARGDREAFLQLLRLDALLLPYGEAPGVCRDPDDDYLLGCAAAGGADYLVTGDHDLLAVRRYQSVAILSAWEFLAMLSPRPELTRSREKRNPPPGVAPAGAGSGPVALSGSRDRRAASRSPTG